MAESHVASHFPNSTLPPCRWFQVAVGALNAIEAPVADFHSDLTEAGPGLRSPKSFTVSQEIWVDKWQALCYHIKHSSLLLVYKHQCVHEDLKHSHLNWSLRRNGKITDNAIFLTLENAFGEEIAARDIGAVSGGRCLKRFGSFSFLRRSVWTILSMSRSWPNGAAVAG